MQNTKVIQKIIWAIDALEESGALQEHTLDALRFLVRTTRAKVEPVYIFSPSQMDLSVEFTGPCAENFRPAAQSVIEDLVDRANIPGIGEPKVLIQHLPTIRQMVHALESHARMENADLILLNTHARKGVARMLMGSFAETLILHSRVPVLVVGPGSRAIQNFDEIIFPTDFGPQSRANFRYVVNLAKEFNSKVLIFHSVVNTLDSVIESGANLLGGSWVPVRNIFDQSVERRHWRAEKWAEWATNQGVPTEVLMRDEGGSVSDQVLEIAVNRNSGLIAMAAQMGPFASTVIGSITRQVVRDASCPVWVLHHVPYEKSVFGKAA